MKQFSIHKVNKPVMRRGAGAESANEEGELSSKQYQTGMVGSDGEVDGADYATGPGGNSGNHEMMQGSSLLTAEEQEALQPKEIKVVNPWIHDATHKEYLESVKVSFITFISRCPLPLLAPLFKYYYGGS